MGARSLLTEEGRDGAAISREYDDKMPLRNHGPAGVTKPGGI
jgi:hypothetical protein